MSDGQATALRLTPEQLDAVVAHAREEAPNECCGVIAARGGAPTRVLRARNAAASPLRFEVDPQDLFRITEELDEAGEDLAVIYHSHTRTAPYPSQTDITFAASWPGVLWLIVGLASPDGEAESRLYAIEDGRVEERELHVG